jgi:hypothetical protein
MESNVNVLIRVRPMSHDRPNTAAAAALPVISINEDSDTISLQRERKLKGNNLDFKFDKVLGPESSQIQLYNCCNLVSDVMDGINCCIIAYGCTSTGKSYAMIGGGLEEAVSNVPSTANSNSNSFRINTGDRKYSHSKPQTPLKFKPAEVIPEENYSNGSKIDGIVDSGRLKGLNNSLTSLFASPRQAVSDEAAVLNTLNTDDDVELVTDASAAACITVDTIESEPVSTEKEIIVDGDGVDKGINAVGSIVDSTLDPTVGSVDKGRYIDQFDTPEGIEEFNSDAVTDGVEGMGSNGATDVTLDDSIDYTADTKSNLKPFTDSDLEVKLGDGVVEGCIEGSIDSNKRTPSKNMSNSSSDTFTDLLENEGGEGIEEAWGIIPRSLVELFMTLEKRSAESGSFEFSVSCQIMQIYNEKVYDLLQDKKRETPLQLREKTTNNHHGISSVNVRVQGLSTYRVHSKEDVMTLLKKGGIYV